jgi:phage shock protein C
MATKKKTENKPEEQQSPTILFRSDKNKMIAGVCGGLSTVFGIDATLVRAIFALTALFGGGGILVYLLLWFIVPTEGKLTNSPDETVRAAFEEMKNKAKVSLDGGLEKDNTKKFIAYSLLFFGVILLAQNFGIFNWIQLGRLWPLLLILAGIVTLTKKG